MDKFKWFDEARFGVFIHWGLYSIPAKGEWVMWNEKIPASEYNRLANEFCPRQDFSPESWVMLAKKAGAKYAVLTTRHHDGFSLYDSKINPFNSVKTAAKRDFVREFVAACRKHGLRVGLYYSVMNWQHSSTITGPLEEPEDWAQMVSETHGQLRELLSDYGKVDMLWYDGCCVPGGRDAALYWDSKGLNAMARKLQPDIMINDRACIPEDFITPEQEITPPLAGRRWESCMTMNNSWGYNKEDQSFKSTDTLIKCLLRCARYGGNLLLNIGPRANGSVPDESVERLMQIGAWLRANGEAIYDSERNAYTEANHQAGVVTCRRNNIYLHLSEKAGDTARLDGVASARKVMHLETGRALPVLRRYGHALDIGNVHSVLKKSVHPVIKIELDNRPEGSANFLGGQHELRIERGNAPILAVESEGVRQLPPGDIWIAGELARFANDTNQPADYEWCPGFQLPVYARSEYDGKVVFDWHYNGKYDLKVGVISCHIGVLKLLVNGQELGEWSIDNPGCPETIIATGIILKRGRVTLQLRGKADNGIYALQISPCWQPIAADRWLAIGPFPTGFEARQPGSSIRDALNLRFGPEDEFDINKSYQSACDGKIIKWEQLRGVLPQEGYDCCGVDFSQRCQNWGMGVCFARTILHSEEEQSIEAAAYFDWWANIYLNDQKIKGTRTEEEVAADGAEFSTYEAARFMLRLKKGQNVLLIKNHCGRGGSGFAFFTNSDDSISSSDGNPLR